jgi:NTE family protein
LTSAAAASPRTALVLSGGGARGAYEAGVLAHLFEHVYPRLPPGFELDVASGTSVGAIHAAYVLASAHLPPAERARRLAETWRRMSVKEVLRVSALDLLGIPLRALGITRLTRRPEGPGPEVIGGLVDISPLERLVAKRIPWASLSENLARRPAALCISCTEVRTGRVTVFMDGALADAGPWRLDPGAQARCETIGPRHVRASAAIPYLFPAVRIGEDYYVDGGLRMSTPLSPALRLGASRVLVVGLKHRPAPDQPVPEFPVESITQPVFLLGKVLDVLMLDHLEYDLHRVGLVNALIERGIEVYGPEFLDKINVAVRAQRGIGYRRVETTVLRPSEDVGRLAAESYERAGHVRAFGLLPTLLTRAATLGAPAHEADLLSYLLFDRCFTEPLVELGREDARRHEDQILAVLGAG